MRPDYSAPDIDTTLAQRQAGAVTNNFINFTAVRALTSGAGTLTTGARAAMPGSAALNDFYYASDVGWLMYWAGTAWKYMAGMGAGSDATRAAITVTANDNGAWYFVTDTDATMGLWQVVAGAWAKKFPNGSIDVATSYKVAGDKVLGARGAAVAAPAGGAVIDVEARAAITALINRFKVTGGHGSIAD